MRWPILAIPALAVALVGTSSAHADDGARGLTVTPLVGAWMPIGDGRRDFKSAPLSGVQVAGDLHPHLALVATFTWVPTGAKRLAPTDIDLFQYDLGLRAQHAFPLGPATTIRPFLGIGEGLRTLRFRGPRNEGGTDFSTHASAGLELGHRAMTAGFTVRHQMAMTNAYGLGSFYQDVEIFGAAGLRF